MIYRFEKDVVTSYYCEVSARSLKEAEEKADDLDEWEEDYGGESETIKYVCKVAKNRQDAEDCSWSKVIETGNYWNNWNH